MKKGLFTLSIVLIAVKSFSQSISHLQSIPDNLKVNTSVVVREEIISFEIKSVNKAFYKVHEIVTILNEKGKSRLSFMEYTDRFHSLENLTIHVFDTLGNLHKKYTKQDLVSMFAGEGLVTDSKLYFLSIPASSYPVTIQYDYDIKFSASLNYPSYNIQQAGQSVQSSSFTLTVPLELDIRYKEKFINLPPQIKTENNKKQYGWNLSNIQALDYEEGSVSAESRYPKIIFSPNKFEMDGYAGDMSTWEKFGEWYGSLSKRSIDLKDERKQFFIALVKDAETDKEKSAILYNYLQQNFRYVSIQLGIGGFKPFEASFTDKNKYGDCKALSNYMQACLEAVGIKSFQALVNAKYNKEPVDPSFPHNAFNHVILCIPLAGDSVWLECTSNTNEFGVLGSFTENRNALLITENGGKLVATPKSIASNNKFITKCVIKLEDNGSGTAKVNMLATGEYKKHFIRRDLKDNQKKYLVDEIGFIQPDDIELKDNLQDSEGLTWNLVIEKIPSFSTGNKMFLNPRIYKIWQSLLPGTGNRKFDFYFPHPFVKNDTTIYSLPSGYTVDALPEPKKIEFEFGSFSCEYKFNKINNEIITVANLQLTNYLIKASGFADAKTFFDNVLAEYNNKIVIKKQDRN